MMAFHWSRVSSSVSPPQVMPALLNIRSMRPVRSTTSSTAVLYGGRVGDVELPRGPRLGQGCGGACGGLAVDVGADHVGTGGGQRTAQGGADSRAGSGDDRLLATEAGHAGHARDAACDTLPPRRRVGMVGVVSTVRHTARAAVGRLRAGRCGEWRPGADLSGQGRDRTGDLPLFRRTLVPTELPGRKAPPCLAAMATLTGLEPATSAVTGRRANQLRHRALRHSRVRRRAYPLRDSNPRYRLERAAS